MNTSCTSVFTNNIFCLLQASCLHFFYLCPFQFISSFIVSCSSHVTGEIVWVWIVCLRVGPLYEVSRNHSEWLRAQEHGALTWAALP